MILARIEEQEHQGGILQKRDKFSQKHKNSFRSTTYTLRKMSPIHRQKLPATDQNQINSLDFRVDPPRSSSQDIPEHTCSNFMKNYVDKLKRQRKRQKKKLLLANNCKAQQEPHFLTCDIAPLPVIHHGKQRILILEQLSPTSYQSSLTHQIPSIRALDNDSITEVIKQIRQYKGRVQIQKNSAIQKKLSEALPPLQKKQGKPRPTITIDRLDPWENEWGNTDASFDQFK